MVTWPCSTFVIVIARSCRTFVIPKSGIFSCIYYSFAFGNKNKTDMKEKYTKDNEGSIQEISNKKLDEIIEQSKLENEALKKILSGLEKLEKENEAYGTHKDKKKKQK